MHSSPPSSVQGPVSLPVNDFREDHGNGAAAQCTALFMEAAKSFYDTFQCKQLAVYLKVSLGGRIVSSLQNTNPGVTIAEIASKIMMKWKEEKGEAATIEELQQVLRHKLKMVDTVEHVWPRNSTSAACSGSQPMPGLETATQQRHVGSVAETTIMDIALSISESYSCQQLAVFLDLSQGSQFVVDCNPHASNREIAYDVMMEWKKENGSAATGEWLFSVLRDQLKMEDLAEKFGGALFGK